MSQHKPHRAGHQFHPSQSSPSAPNGFSPSRRSPHAASAEELVGGQSTGNQQFERPHPQPQYTKSQMGPTPGRPDGARPDGVRHDGLTHGGSPQAITHDIQAITHYLRNESPLLDLVAIDLYQHLIEQYGAELDQEMTSDTILTTLKDWAREQCDRHNHWVQTAEGISANLVSKAIQSMERDLGHSVLESLDWHEFNQILFQYLFEHPATPIKHRLEPLEEHYAQMLSQQIVSELELDHQSISSLKRNLGLAPHTSHPIPLLGQTLSHVGPIPEIASEMPLMVGENWDGDLLFSDQFQADLWASDAREVAYLRYQAKQRRHQYLEHYLTTDADLDNLSWDGIAQILTKFGLTAAKLHLLLLAYSVQQTDWHQPFTVTVDQLVTDLGWHLLSSHSTTSVQSKKGHASGKRGGQQTNLNVPMPQTKVTNVLYALSCILVKLVWVEHSDTPTGAALRHRSVIGQTPVGKLWDMVITPSGEFDWQTGQVETARHISVIARPGLWIEGIQHLYHPSAQSHRDLNSPATAEFTSATLLADRFYPSPIQQKLWQCRGLARQLLHLGAYTQDLTVRMVVHLMLDMQTQTSEAPTQHYTVQTLLEQVVPPATLARAKTHIKQGQQLFKAWNGALMVLAQLQWYPDASYADAVHSNNGTAVIQNGYSTRPTPSTDRPQTKPIQTDLTQTDPTQFYTYPYPKWLAPHSTMRKPRGWVQTWLDQTIQIRRDIHTLEYV